LLWIGWGQQSGLDVLLSSWIWVLVWLITHLLREIRVLIFYLIIIKFLQFVRLINLFWKRYATQLFLKVASIMVNLVNILSTLSISNQSLLLLYWLVLLNLVLIFEYSSIFIFYFCSPDSIYFSALLRNFIDLNIILILLIIILWLSHGSLIVIRERRIYLNCLIIILLWYYGKNLLRCIYFFNGAKNKFFFIFFIFLAWFRIRKSAIRNILTIFSVLIEDKFWKTRNTTTSFTYFGYWTSMSRLWPSLTFHKLIFRPSFLRFKLFFIRIWIWKRKLII
jgi:hypothetical protein